MKECLLVAAEVLIGIGMVFLTAVVVILFIKLVSIMTRLL